MDAAVWGLLGTIVGALASIGTTWISGRHAFSLQRQAASEEQMERQRAFQRETLIQLQEAVNDHLRMMTRAHIEDTDAFKKSGNWGRSLLSEEVNDGVRVTGRKVAILVQRIADDALRSSIKSLTTEIAQVIMAKSQVEADGAFTRVYNSGDSAMEHIGTVLRKLLRGRRAQQTAARDARAVAFGLTRRRCVVQVLKRRFGELAAQLDQLGKTLKSKHSEYSGDYQEVDPATLLGWCVKARSLLVSACGKRLGTLHGFRGS
ncbi:MAG: hypothetical protein U1E63_09370 [Burkholderiales bacterium]